MTVTRLFPYGSVVSYSRYVYDLVAAMRDRDWVADPSIALTSDANVYRKVMRDPVAALAIRYRRHMTAGREWTVKPGGETEEDRIAASTMEALIRKIRRFADSRALLADAIFRGSAYAFVEGRRFTDRILDEHGAVANWWAPTRLADVDRRRFRLVAWDPSGGDDPRHWEIWSLERAVWEHLEHPEWFVRSIVEESEDSLGYGRGLLDTLYYYQAAKTRVLQDALAASERFGQGLIKVGVQNYRGAEGKPVDANDDRNAVARAWQDTISKGKARHCIVHDAEDQVEVLEAGRGWELLMRLLDYLDTAQTVTVLGSNLTTKSDGGGSYALAKIQENTTQALIDHDRQRLEEDLDADLLELTWRLNRQQLRRVGLGKAKRPTFQLVHSSREDPSASVALVTQLVAQGIPLRAEDVYKRTGFNAPRPGEVVYTQEGAARVNDDGVTLTPLGDQGGEAEGEPGADEEAGGFAELLGGGDQAVSDQPMTDGQAGELFSLLQRGGRPTLGEVAGLAMRHHSHHAGAPA